MFYDVKLEDIKWTSDFRAKFISVKVKISDGKMITINDFENLKAYLPEKLIISQIDTFSLLAVTPHSDCEIHDSSECWRYTLEVGVDIGSMSPIGKTIGIKFHDLQDVFDNYDTIVSILLSKYIFPDFNCIVSDDTFSAYVLLPRYIGTKTALWDLNWEISYKELINKCFNVDAVSNK